MRRKALDREMRTLSTMQLEIDRSITDLERAMGKLEEMLKDDSFAYNFPEVSSAVDGLSQSISALRSSVLDLKQAEERIRQRWFEEA